MRKFLLGLVSLCVIFSLTGCASRTRVKVVTTTVGLSSEAHKFRPLGVSKNAQGENVLCLGFVSLGSFASIDQDPTFLSVTSETGKTADVNATE